jgi:hypothetical protein
VVRPAHLRNEVRVECDVTPRHLTIVECRPPWRNEMGEAWTRFPIARLRYTKATRLWSLCWHDRHLRFHLYDRLAPSPRIDEVKVALLAGCRSIPVVGTTNTRSVPAPAGRSASR